jgi:hypothetical protein
MNLSGFVDNPCDEHLTRCRGVECRTCGTVIARHLGLAEALTAQVMADRGHVCPIPGS